MINQSDLFDKLNRGPAFLLLGQKYLKIETGTDPFLTEIVRKYGENTQESITYQQLFGGQASISIESSLAWMQERCKRLTVPEWLGTVASFAWNGVYTSAIDVIWQNAFKSHWREIEPIFTEEKDPIDARSRTKLHCTYLFGAVDQSSEEQRPPLTRMQMNRRRQVAVSLLRRLPRLVTPLGVLIIEGYSLDNDWLPVDDLLAVIDEMRTGQVHLFHADSEIANYVDVQTLTSSGKLTLYDQSLASFLRRGEDVLELGFRPDDTGEGYRIRIGKRTVTLPISLWNQVSRSAIILDDEIGSEASPMSLEKRHMEFRNFLARSGDRPAWTGYQQGFAFKRDFEDQLLNEVQNSLRNKGLATTPVILHGRSGIGKTIALGSLGYNIGSQGEYPVLFIERKPLRPNYHDLDQFVEWAEDNGANATLIIWDGMLDYDQYLDTLERLTSRGRKVVLVGSSYRHTDGTHQKDPSPRKDFIEAPSELSESEIDRFEAYLNDIVPHFGSVRSSVKTHGAHFFVALYRILPKTRSQLRSSINLEAAYTEEQIAAITNNVSVLDDDSIFRRPLAYAFIQAGLTDEKAKFSEEQEEIGGEYINQIQQLIGFVMVPGRFGMRVPIELLMRTIGYDIPYDIVNILSNIDLFNWSTDSMENITIGPRHALEAELISRSRLGGPKYEVEFIARLVRNISSADTEIQFALDLIRNVNPSDESQYSNVYAPHLIEVADSLTYIREKHGLINPRLMLQETNLLRETAKLPEHELSAETPHELLDRAEAVINSALEIVGQEGFNADLRSQLLVELASTLGSRAKNLYISDPKSAVQYFLHLKQYLFDARSVSRNNFYPIDVLFWTAQDLVKCKNAPMELQLDAEAELLNVFEMAQLEETFTNLHRFQERKQQLGYLLKDTRISDEAFAELDKQGSTAGYVFKAAQIAGTVPHDRPLTDSEVANVSGAAAFLEENRRKLVHDGRSLQMLLRYWWLSTARKPIFWSERQTVPFSPNDWAYCSELLTDTLRCNEVYRAPIIQYLLGVTLFHVNSIENAEKIFRELEMDTSMRGRRRILRSYLVSRPDGQPKKYSGTVDWVDSGRNRGEIYIPEIRKRVPFIPTDFRLPDIVKGSAVNDFHIAFNFLGFIADPVGYLSHLERQETS